jgi:hypothetical protein
VNFEDFFEKSDSAPQGSFGRGGFDRSFSPPGVNEEPPAPKPWAAFFAGLTSVVLLSLTEGTLVWLIFESLEDLGFVDERLPWNPFVLIAFAVNLIRVFDKAAYGRK